MKTEDQIEIAPCVAVRGDKSGLPAKQDNNAITQSTPKQLISVVDDDEAFRKATVNLLRVSGFSAEGPSSAEEFLDLPHANETGCLILDLQMPGRSGLEMQRHLAAVNRRIPIIFITAHGCVESGEEAMRAGAVDFLPKPFSEEALRRAIYKALT